MNALLFATFKILLFKPEEQIDLPKLITPSVCPGTGSLDKRSLIFLQLRSILRICKMDKCSNAKSWSLSFTDFLLAKSPVR